MMMNFEKRMKVCFAVGMVLISTCAAAVTTQFTKGKSWLSKNTYYPAQTQNAALANPSGRTKLMAASKYNAADDCRVFDITISMYRERTEEERAAICDIITNFAAVVYEATDGKHKIGKVWILGNESSDFCDVVWKGQGRSCASLYRERNGIPLSGQIQMFEAWVDKDGRLLRDFLGDPEEGGAVFAHEWSHAQYGLGDEYEEQDETFYWQRNGINASDGSYYCAHGGDIPVALSLMNTTSSNFGKVVAALNFSISPNAKVGAEYEGHKSTGCHYVWVNGERYFIGATSQYRLYGKSAWEQLKDPSESLFHITTPVFEEFSQHDVNTIPSYELVRKEGVRAALSDLEIIWAQDRLVIVYLCIDLSGSMSALNVKDVKERAISLIKGLPIGTVVGVATFSDSDNFQRYVRLMVITDENRKLIVQAITEINSGNGNTAIWDAAMNALEDIRTFAPNDIQVQKNSMLKVSNLSEGTERNRGAASIILLTDGQDNDSVSDSQDVIAKCKELGVSFNTIGYGSGADNENLNVASKATGGHHHSSSQDGNSLTEALLRQFASSSFRVVMADYSCTSVAQQTFARSFFVDSTLTNVIMNVVLSRATADDVVQFIAPDGTVCSGERTETSTGVTYAYRAASCAVGEWTVTASVGKDVETTIYADADSVGDDMRVSGAISGEETPKLVVSIDAMHSITGAQVTACVPCDGYIREVQFKENGLGCYSLDLVRCGPEAAKNGLTVRCDIRKGEAYVNYDDGLVSPALDEGSESVKESKTRVIHFTADELKDLVGNVQASGSAEVNNVKVSSRWPFDSKLDIDFTVTCANDQPALISVVGHDYDLNRELRATSLSGVDVSKPIASGTYRLTWDIARDYPEFHAKKFSVKVFSALELVGSNASHGDNDSGVELVWTAASQGSISYEIWRSEQCDVATATLLATVKSGPYVDTTAIPGVLYYYWIRALGPDGAGEFGWPSVGYRDIAAPIGIQASDGTSSDGVEISWLPVDSATAYEVCRGTSDSCNPERVAVVSETCYVDTSATPGVDYYYWIRAKAPACTSQFGTSDLGWRKIVAPLNVSASDGTSENGVAVSWSGSVPEVRYEVYRSETSSISDAESIGCCEGSTFTDTSGQAGHAYYYWVRATVGNRMSEVTGPDRGWRTAKLSGNALYLVVDVTDGASASKYPFYEMDAIPGGKWSDEYKRTKIVLRRCPNGEFYMGSPSGETGRNSANEKRHKVTLTKPFYIGVFEITQTQWTLIVGGNPSRRNGAARVQCPVEAAYDWIVPGKNAVSFIGLLRSKTGLGGFNLPTEAQWEYACRAGTTTAINTGKSLSSQYEDSNMSLAARYMYTDGDNGLTRYNRVGCYLPNNWGLYDMHGNVAEWCLDYYTDSLGTTAKTDPTGPTSGTMRVLRGGSYADYAKGCRSASRVGAASRVGNDSDEDYVGFRLYKSIP